MTIRETAKSMIRFSLAMTLFGARQMVNLLSKPDDDPAHSAGAAMDAVSSAVEANLDETFKQAYRAGDHIQSGVVDTVATVLGADRLEAAKLAQSATESIRHSAGAAVESIRRSRGVGPDAEEPKS